MRRNGRACEILVLLVRPGQPRHNDRHMRLDGRMQFRCGTCGESQAAAVQLGANDATEASGSARVGFRAQLKVITGKRPAQSNGKPPARYRWPTAPGARAIPQPARHRTAADIWGAEPVQTLAAGARDRTACRPSASPLLGRHFIKQPKKNFMSALPYNKALFSCKRAGGGS